MALGFALPAAGGAATVVGTEVPPAPTAAAIGCDPGPSCVATFGSGVRVPVSGVVTRWRTLATAPTSMSLVRIRSTAVEFADSGTFPHSTQGLMAFPAGPVEAAVRLGVTEGDRISVSWGGILTGTVPADPASPFTYTVRGADFTSPSMPVFQATIEPDADGDRLGDESQDLCPTSRQGACPGLTFTPDAAPRVMPGQLFSRTIMVSLAGPGRTPPGTRLFVSGKAGISASLDGQPCGVVEGEGDRRMACTLGAAGPGRTFSLIVTVPQARGPKTTVRLVAEATDMAAYPAIFKLWPSAPATATVITPVPELDELRPRIGIAPRLRRGRIAARLSCPKAGTQPCRIRVAVRPAVSGARPFASATVRLAQGSTRTVRLRPTGAIARRIRDRPLAVIATATRTDLLASKPSGSVTVKLRAR